MSSEFHTFHIHSQFTQLLGYIRRGHLDSVADLLSSPTVASQVLHLRDRNGRTALHHCADTLLPSGPNGTTTTTTNLDPKSRSNQLFDIAHLLLKTKPSLVESQDNEGNTALQLAVINGNLGLTKLMIRSMSKVQLNMVDYELHSAVHWATVCGELECLAVVLDAGAEVSTGDIYGAHPLHYATQSFAELNCLPPHSTSLNLRGQSALFGTTHHHNSALAQQKYSTRRANGLCILHHILARPNIDVNCSDNEGRTPLLWAASSGNSDALLALVKAGAEISQQDKDGLSALHCASSRGHYKCAEILIMICGADVHQVDSSGCTPLFYATALGHPDCVRLLLESGGDVDHQDHKGRTAAHCGASKGQLETLKILHQHGANLWLKNVRGDLPLHEAIKSGRKDLVKWLLDLSPKSINEVNLYGRSVLHIAAFNNNVDLSRLLVERGADLNAVMKVRSQYLTPLDAAHQNASEEVANYLQSQGGQPIVQIDQHLAEYLQSSSPIKELGARKRRQAEAVATEGEEEARTTKDQRPVDADQTSYTKLPNLMGSSGGAAAQGEQRAHSRTALSTGSSSTMDLGHHGHQPTANRLHNCREFEHNLALEKPTHLKQAIITNVYLTTTGVPAGTAAPVYYVKRVPPLKKGHHQMKGSTSGTSGTKRRSGSQGSRSRSKDQQQQQLPNGSAASRTNAVMMTDDDEEEAEADGHGGAKMATRASVILEAHDTFKSEFETRDEKLLITQELTTEEESEDQRIQKTSQERKLSMSASGEEETSGGEKRGKRSISGDDDDDQTKAADTKEADVGEEAEVEAQEEADPAQAVEPLRTRDDDSGFETEAAKVKAKAEDAEDAEDATAEAESLSRKDSTDSTTTKGPRLQETKELTEETTEKMDEDETKGFFSRTAEKVKETSQKAVEETKELLDQTTNKVKGVFGPKQDSTEELETKKKKEEDSEVDDKESSPLEKRDAIMRDFVQNVKEEDEKVEVGEESEDGDKEVRKKRSIAEEEDQLDSADKEEPTTTTTTTRKLSKANSRTSIVSGKSSAAGSAASSRGTEEEEAESRTSSRKASAKSVKSTKSSAEVSDKEEEEEEVDEADGKDDEEEDVSRITGSEAERSTLGDMVEDDGEEEVQEEPEEEEEETRKKRSIDEEEPDSKAKVYDTKADKVIQDDPLRRESKPLEPIDETSFEGSTPDVRKEGGSREVVEVQVHAQKSVDQESIAEEVEEEEIVPKKIKEEDDGGEYGKVKRNLDGEEEEEEDEEDEAHKGEVKDSTVEGYLDQVVTNAKEEGFDDLKSSPEQRKSSVSDDEEETVVEEPKNSLKPIVADQRRKRSVSYDTAVDLRSLIREPESDATKPEAVLEESQSSRRKLSRAKVGEPEDHDASADDRGGDHHLEVPDDDDAASVATFSVQEDDGNRRMAGDSEFRSKPLKYKTSKKYDHIGPKVDSYWNYSQENLVAGRKLTKGGGGARGSKEMIAGESAEEQYAKINPKIINQTVEKYLRKYYLERKLFEELYDLKRYQIRTGKSNEPQAVKRLVEKFRRELRAPGMADFKGPYSYRAYEMYLYDQLRKLSRSNERKIAFMDKSASYEDLNSSFDKSDIERPDLYSSSPYYDSSSPTRGHHHKSRKSRAAGAGAGAASKEDPLLDYDDRHPFGLSVDYKYEYHKSQHMDRAGKELIDVICENLYKRTGLNGAKVDEVAITRKVVERKADEKDEEEESRGGSSGEPGATAEPEESTNAQKPPAPPAPSQVSTLGPSRAVAAPAGSSSLLSGPPLSSFFRRPKPKREPMVIPPRRRIQIPRQVIEQRWAPIKGRARRRQSDRTPERRPPSSPPPVSLWYELNKQPWQDYYQNLDYLDRYLLYSSAGPGYYEHYGGLSRLSDHHHHHHHRPASFLQRTHSDPDSLFNG